MCCRIFDEIKRLNIPQRVKAELLILATRARNLALKILAFIRKNRHIGEAMVLGCIIAFLVAHLPWIGGFLALCALVTAAAWGFMKQVEADILEIFASEMSI